MFNDIRIFTGTTTGAGPRRDFHITYFAIKLCVASQSALLAASNFRGALISRLGQMHDRMLGCVSCRFCNNYQCCSSRYTKIRHKSVHQSPLRHCKSSSKHPTRECFNIAISLHAWRIFTFEKWNANGKCLWIIIWLFIRKHNYTFPKVKTWYFINFQNYYILVN